MGAGYFAAQGPLDTSMILRVASELFNGQTRVHATGDDPAAHPGSYGGRTQTQKGSNPKRRPSVFEPFASRQDWKDGQASAEEAQKYVKQVVDNAQKVYKDGSTFLDLIFGRSSTGSDGKDKSDSDGRKTRSQTREPRRARA
ncbi:10228_t:CDS:1 [Acaulospora colombiana]|uniref:10228_t:CDS:1 n=1 Tax=Acaulospora colombiana TaxID=27376 RepID=A0ACA9MPF8_9GLOM|nr:10228_t:CDS:1 [Acaulospora colombiana]